MRGENIKLEFETHIDDADFHVIYNCFNETSEQQDRMH